MGRVWRPFLERTPKQSFGYVASKDAIRVGYDLSLELRPLTRFAAQIDLSPSGRGDARAACV
ncbi:hypothetical protein ACVIHD_006894 [Bradyrhizobium embrapense]